MKLGMLTRAEEPDVAVKKKRSGKPKRDDKAVKMDRIVVDKANWVATRRGITAAEYLTEMVRSQVERDFAKEVKETGVK
jgi:hypothetical protein